MNTQIQVSPARHPAVTSLAIVGFVAIVIAGLWLAVYSTRFVPGVVNRIGSAAVYIGSVFTPAPNSNNLSVVPTPTASTTISFGTAPATSTTQTSTTKPKPTSTGNGEKTSTVIKVGTTTPATLTGLGDLAVNVDTTGYMTTNTTDSFVASTTVPHGDNAAVRFTIKNVGTNWSGTWTFSASIPTYPAYTYTSQPQQSLAPGDSIDYTLGFNQANVGSNKIITISINPGVSDSNAANNTTSAAVTVQ
jgi:hypothetical protein